MIFSYSTIDNNFETKFEQFLSFWDIEINDDDSMMIMKFVDFIFFFSPFDPILVGTKLDRSNLFEL